MYVYQIIDFEPVDARDDPACYGDWPHQVYKNFEDAQKRALEMWDDYLDEDDMETDRSRLVLERNNVSGLEVLRYWRWSHPDIDNTITIYEVKLHD